MKDSLVAAAKTMFKKLLLVFFISSHLFAQVGGEHVYPFLNTSTSARQVALGGSTLTLNNEVNQALWNPALISPDIDNQLALNYLNFLTDINYYSVDYAYTIDKHIGTFYSNLTYLNYGKFIAADEYGNETGTFKANDFAFTVGYGYQIPRLDVHLGINTKIINSSIENYNSTALAADLGVYYKSYGKPYDLALVIRNAGTQLSSYDGTIESLPIKITAGTSYRLEHVPLKFYGTLDNLQRWQLAYSNPSDETIDLDGNVTENKPSFFNNLFRHVVLGVELFPDRGFSVRAGYNYQRAQELKLNDRRTFAGLTAGFGLKLNRFKFNYAFSKFHPATDTHTFSLALNLNK